MGFRLSLKLIVILFMLSISILMLYLYSCDTHKNFEEIAVTDENPKFIRITVIKNDKIEYHPYSTIPILHEHRNEVRVSKGECLQEIKNTTSDHLEMIGVTNYIPVDILLQEHSMYTGRLRRQPTHDETEARIAEITSCFQANLKHPLLKTLYVFVQHEHSLKFLQSLNFENRRKLVIVWINKTIEVTDELLYISKCLHGHVVLKLHQDNRIGTGFEKLKPSILIENKLMYALTRHSPYERHCFYGTDYGVCDPKAFQGSHDAFMFHVKGFSMEQLDVISSRKIEAHEEGMENVFVWIFRRRLGYKVINPCIVLHIHHEHCVPIRRKHRRRVDKNHSHQANPTNKFT